MSIKISMQTTGIDDALAEIAALTPASKRAATRAQNKLAKWVGARGASAIAKANQLPVKVMRQRLRVVRAKPSTGRVDKGARVWIGTLPIASRKAGRVRQTSTGAAAGKHVYPDFFVATMPSGHTGVFTRMGTAARWTWGRPRTSPPNLPIVEANITLQDLHEIRAEMLQEGGRRYRELLVQELNYELNVRNK